MKCSLLKSRFSRGQGIDGPGHAVGKAGHEVESYGGVVEIVPLVVRFSGVGFEVIDFASASAVCGDEFVAVGADHGGMGWRIFVALHGVVIFAVDVVAVLVEGRVAFQERLEGAALHGGMAVEADPFEDGGCKVNEFDECIRSRAIVAKAGS